MTWFHRATRQAYTPLLTPFVDDVIDFQALGAAIDRQIVAGMDGIIVCDVTGEGYALTQAERDAVLRTCVSRGSQHLSVIAAAGTNCTRTTIEQCRRAEELGADALLVTVPYYSRPTLAGVVDHFAQVASALSKPVIVDDDPGRTARDYGILLPERLANIDLIAGICHGPDRIGHFSRLPQVLRERFTHFSRDDATLFRFMETGGNGIFSPLANIIPSPVQTLVSMTKDVALGSPLAQSTMNAAAALGRDDIAALKEAASFIHQSSPEVRLPMVAAEPETIIRIRQAFAPFARCEATHQAVAA